ncbi:MAG: AbrB/MazE/SpoVT family DNA-binding domain-containing protein [Acidobacteriota bacterium]
MSFVKLSSKYQIVIPKAIRESLRLKPGQSLQILLYGDRILMILIKIISEMKGFLKGINTHIEPELDRF